MAERGDVPLSVEVVWIGVDPPLRIGLTLPGGSTVAAALAQGDVAARIRASGPLPPGQGPLDGLSVAVFGRPVGPDDPLHDHDRVELLPPLRVDPKVARQRRAEHRRRESGERRWAPDRQRSPPKPRD
jgi:putative ubiquitin-RnfH superfamily antitoxin RatB of RatAB toxin-antitoxin module